MQIRLQIGLKYVFQTTETRDRRDEPVYVIGFQDECERHDHVDADSPFQMPLRKDRDF